MVLIDIENFCIEYRPLASLLRPSNSNVNHDSHKLLMKGAKAEFAVYHFQRTISNRLVPEERNSVHSSIEASFEVNN